MRNVLLLSCILVSYPAISFGQVTIDLKALDSLPAARPGPERPASPRAAPPKLQTAPTTATGQRATTPSNSMPTAAPTGGPNNRSTGQPSLALPFPLPASPLPAPALPAGPPPALVTESAPAAPVAPSTQAAASTVQSNLRLLFAGAQTELGPDNAAAIKQVLSRVPANEAPTFNVVAYAAGAGDDPSIARRLSLSRALAVRTALIGGGIPSSRIYIRALGGQIGNGPPDRVDIDIQGLTAGNSAVPAGAR